MPENALTGRAQAEGDGDAQSALTALLLQLYVDRSRTFSWNEGTLAQFAATYHANPADEATLFYVMKHSYFDSARITAILEQAGKIDGIDDMRKSQDATASLSLRSGREVLFTYRSSAAGLFAYMRMCRLPIDPEQRGVMMPGLLTTNFLRRGTSEGEFAIDTDGVTVIFQIALSPASLTVSKLDQVIDTLARLDFSVEDFLCIGSRSSARSRSTQTSDSNSTRARLLRSHTA